MMDDLDKVVAIEAAPDVLDELLEAVRLYAPWIRVTVNPDLPPGVTEVFYEQDKFEVN